MEAPILERKSELMFNSLEFNVRIAYAGNEWMMRIREDCKITYELDRLWCGLLRGEKPYSFDIQIEHKLPWHEKRQVLLNLAFCVE